MAFHEMSKPFGVHLDDLKAAGLRGQIAPFDENKPLVLAEFGGQVLVVCADNEVARWRFDGFANRLRSDETPNHAVVFKVATLGIYFPNGGRIVFLSKRSLQSSRGVEWQAIFL